MKGDAAIDVALTLPFNHEEVYDQSTQYIAAGEDVSISEVDCGGDEWSEECEEEVLKEC